MSADFTPNRGEYTSLQPFRFWCQKVLPLVYDDSLSYYELLCKVVDYLNKTMEDVETLEEDITKMYAAYEQLQSYVNSYFDNLDVQEEINNKLDNMAEDGTLGEILGIYLKPYLDAQDEKIDVLEARMDTFTNLAEGSTTGDAELADIRIMYNGQTAATAGDAVREQADLLQTQIDMNTAKNAVIDLHNTKALGFSYENGAVNANDLTVSTESVTYKHGEYLLNGEKKLLCGCYHFSDNYPAWFFVDSLNHVIAKSKSRSTNTAVIENIGVPENAYKLIFNFRQVTQGYYNNIFLLDASEQPEYSADIKTALKNAGGVLTLGSSINAYLQLVVNDNYCYKEIPVTSGEIYYIDAHNFSSTAPAVFMVDASNNVIYLPELPYDTDITSYKVTVPNNAVTMYLNARVSKLPNAFKVVNTVDDLHDYMERNTRNDNIALTSVYPSVTYGSVMQISGEVGSNANYLMMDTPVTGGQDYYISGRYTSPNYPVFLFKDADGDICGVSRGLKYPGTNIIFRDYKITAPLDAAMLYVSARYGDPFDIKIMDKSISAVLNDNALMSAYIGRTPISELTETSGTVNNEKVARNESRFSTAYALMLSRIMQTFPTSKIICCTINECERKTFETGFPERVEDGTAITDYNKIIRELAERFGAILVDHHCCGINYYNLDNYVDDYVSETGYGLHPNAAGMELIAEQTLKDLSGYDFTGKTVSIFGDSISTYNGSGSEYNHYPSGDVNAISKTWWHISLITGKGMTLLHNSSGGGKCCGSLCEGVENRPLAGCNQTSINTLGVDGADPDVIIIKLGVNDFGRIGNNSNRDGSGHYQYGGI